MKNIILGLAILSASAVSAQSVKTFTLKKLPSKLSMNY